MPEENLVELETAAHELAGLIMFFGAGIAKRFESLNMRDCAKHGGQRSAQ